MYYSKERGPPRLRFQPAGVKGKRFYKLIACNRRDPMKGKHMEVLGSYAPKVNIGVKEIRLRFSRVKFWLGVGADMSRSTASVLSLSGLIPAPPPIYGRRTKDHWSDLQKIMLERQKVRDIAIEEYLMAGGQEGLHIK
eukprot:GEMP01103567.1.p2 GENE.GEMP01103567.1~~GEMP01103567.1.p2  ORF type:complete len:138 (+),score=8.44 GEMP01103567.1:151-564(+)